MAAILAIGVATLDIVCLLERYPAEDAKLRALSSRRVRGGNAANTLAVLARLGHRTRWAGSLARDAAAAEIVADFELLGIEHGDARWFDAGVTPTSYVWQSRATGSRTIVHDRRLDEFDHAAFAAIDLSGLDWLHFEGRAPEETRRMIASARERRPGLSISLEVEKPRPGIEALFDGPDLICFSHDYAVQAGYADDPEALLRDAASRAPLADLVCTRGEYGAWSLHRGGDEVVHAPALAVERIVDTLGAGDSFNAALIDARLAGLGLAAAVERACRLAGRKCGHEGLDFITARDAAGRDEP